MSIKYTDRKTLINSTRYICLLSLLFIAFSFHSIAATKHHKVTKQGVIHSMTVIDVGPLADDAHNLGVIFRISQMKYKLPKDANPEYLRLLKESEKNHTPVLVERATEQSNVIISVKKDTTKKAE
jgi:hypothetical protein